MPRFDETLSNQAWPRKGQADIWRRVEEKKMRKVTSLLAVASLVGVATLVLAGGSASAQSTCDFLTGGGFIIRPRGAKANLGVAGGGQGGCPPPGHLRHTDPCQRPQAHVSRLPAYLFA